MRVEYPRISTHVNGNPPRNLIVSQTCVPFPTKQYWFRGLKVVHMKRKRTNKWLRFTKRNVDPLSTRFGGTIHTESWYTLNGIFAFVFSLTECELRVSGRRLFLYLFPKNVYDFHIGCFYNNSDLLIVAIIITLIHIRCSYNNSNTLIVAIIKLY